MMVCLTPLDKLKKNKKYKKCIIDIDQYFSFVVCSDNMIDLYHGGQFLRPIKFKDFDEAFQKYKKMVFNKEIKEIINE